MKTGYAHLLTALFAALLVNGFVVTQVVAATPDPPKAQMPQGSMQGEKKDQPMMDMGKMDMGKMNMGKMDMGMMDMGTRPMSKGCCGMCSMSSQMDVLGPIAKLDLTKEQRSQLAQQRKDLRRKQAPLAEKLADYSDQMTELQMSDKPNFSEIGRIYGLAEETRYAMAAQPQEAYQHALMILRMEQRDLLEEQGSSRGMCGGQR